MCGGCLWTEVSVTDEVSQVYGCLEMQPVGVINLSLCLDGMIIAASQNPLTTI